MGVSQLPELRKALVGKKLTREEEEHEPVHEQDGPEDRHVEDLEPAADEGNGDGPRSPVPELELGKASNKGLELVVLAGGKGAHGAILHLIIDGLIGGVELRGEEGEKQVQEVDS